MLWRDCSMLATYAGVTPATIAYWRTKGLLRANGSVVYLKRLDTIALHAFIRKAPPMHASITKIKPSVIRRALRASPRPGELPKRFRVPPVWRVSQC